LPLNRRRSPGIGVAPAFRRRKRRITWPAAGEFLDRALHQRGRLRLAFASASGELLLAHSSSLVPSGSDRLLHTCAIVEDLPRRRPCWPCRREIRPRPAPRVIAVDAHARQHRGSVLGSWVLSSLNLAICLGPLHASSRQRSGQGHGSANAPRMRLTMPGHALHWRPASASGR
jgi:hypothetical protein